MVAHATRRVVHVRGGEALDLLRDDLEGGVPELLVGHDGGACGEAVLESGELLVEAVALGIDLDDLVDVPGLQGNSERVRPLPVDVAAL